jgi:predicted amidohydrolase YtcJ
MRLTLNNQPHVPEKALTMREALRAHTLGAAYTAQEETIKGSKENGESADLTWGNSYPLTTPPGSCETCR